MIQKLVVLSYLIISAACMVLHPQPVPVLFNLQYHDEPNYSFAYNVNDPHTGDIKNQHESRRSDIILGQYSLVQPDGIRSTVDYRTDHHAGFLATVNNDGRTAPHFVARPAAAFEEASRPNPSLQTVHPWPAQASTTQAPVAISRSSIHQTFSNGQNPWM